MNTIYCIEDINNLKYVGRTKLKLNIRLNKHKHDKKINNYCSSKQLDLDNCEIYSLETCNESQKKAREKYWINNIDCVNKYKLNIDYKDDYRMKRKIELQNQLRKRKYTWGGDPRFHNNLLKIDIDIFTSD